MNKNFHPYFERLVLMGFEISDLALKLQWHPAFLMFLRHSKPTISQHVDEMIEVELGQF